MPGQVTPSITPEHQKCCRDESLLMQRWEQPSGLPPAMLGAPEHPPALFQPGFAVAAAPEAPSMPGSSLGAEQDPAELGLA